MAARTTPSLVWQPKPRPLPEPPEKPMRVNFNDLPTRTLAQIERLAGVSMARWQLADSNADQLAAVVAVMYDCDMEAALEESPRSLARYFEVVEDEDDESGN